MIPKVLFRPYIVNVPPMCLLAKHNNASIQSDPLWAKAFTNSMAIRLGSRGTVSFHKAVWNVLSWESPPP